MHLFYFIYFSELDEAPSLVLQATASHKDPFKAIRGCRGCGLGLEQLGWLLISEQNAKPALNGAEGGFARCRTS